MADNAPKALVGSRHHRGRVSHMVAEASRGEDRLPHGPGDEGACTRSVRSVSRREGAVPRAVAAEPAPVSGKVLPGPGGMSIVVGCQCRHTHEVKARALILVAVLLNAAAAVLASWLLLA